MGVGGMVMFGVGSFFGVFAASMLHRWSATLGATDAVPTGFPDAATYNSLAVDAKPTMNSIGFQAGFSILSFVAAGVLKPIWAKLFFAGAGIGSAVHLASQVAIHYVMLPLFGTSTWVMRAYAHEIQADKALYPATPAPAPATTTTASTTAGLPGRAAPPVRALPAAQPPRIPSALAAQPMPVAARPGGARAPGPFPFRASGLGQTNAPTAPAGTILVPNMNNGNCPDGATTVTNPENLDQPWCYAPAPPASNTPPSPATPPPTPPPPATPPPTPPPVVVVTPTPPNGMTPPPSQYTTAPCAPAPCPPACQDPLDGLNAASNAAIAAAPPPSQVIAALNASAAPCCGQSPCGCGCQHAMGAPPDPATPNGAGVAHPMFANLLRDMRAGTRRTNRAA